MTNFTLMTPHRRSQSPRRVALGPRMTRPYVMHYVDGTSLEHNIEETGQA